MEFETLKRSHLKRNIIIGIIAVVIISAIVLNFTRAKYKVTQSIPLVNGTINYSPGDIIITAYFNNKQLETFPTKDSGYSVENVTCDKDATASFNENTWELEVNNLVQKGTKCDIYFEEKKISAANTIADLVNTSDEVVTDDFGNVRFIRKNPNNYVYFNCDDYNNPSSSTCELWRIIGVFSEDTHGKSNSKLVKLIKNSFIGNFSWDTEDDSDWTTSSLQQSLNTSYLNGSTLGSGKGITSQTKNMIETVTWKLGGTAASTSDNVLTSQWYKFERGTNVYSGQSTIWSGKIGLMYPSDYGYATSGGSTYNRAACLASKPYNWDSSSYSDCKNNDWLYNSGYTQWTLTPDSSRRGYIFRIDTTGCISYNYIASWSFGVRPSIYLKSDITITGGNGSSATPYTIKGAE